LKYWWILIVFLIGCEFIDQPAHFESVVNDEGSVSGVYFCPRDDCSEVLSDFILSASESVHCAFYELNLENVISALEEQNEKIDVKLVLDDRKGFEGDYIVLENKSSYMHDKFCIVDGSRVITGSMNPTFNGDEKNNNNLLIVESSVIANNYEEEFEELWNGIYSKGGKTKVPVVYLDGVKIKNYFCPEDECGEKLEEVIDSASSNIKFLLFSFTHNEIANSMLMRMQDGVSVQGVFEKRGAGGQYSKFKLFEYQGADVKKDNNNATMHHKVIIIDDSIVVTGSFNPSKNADTVNDENILVIYDPEIASLYLEEFDYVWNS